MQLVNVLYMWKDFFYFSKGERRAILVLVVFILLAQAALWTTDYWMPLLPEKLTNASAGQDALKRYQDSLFGQKDPNKKTAYPSYGNSNRHYSHSAIPVRLRTFNPNAADSVTLLSLGLRPYVAKNVLQYRRKGGTFRKAEDLARIYGMDPALYTRLRPFIRTTSEESPTRNLTERGKGLQADYSVVPESRSADNPVRLTVLAERVNETVVSAAKPSGMMAMDINKADTAALQQLKGVGSSTASRVAQYRSRLGGYYSVRQLEEIKGLYPDVLVRLQSMLKVDTTQISKINANKASLERLKAHPYISFYQARVIVELRKARSGIRSINELADFKEFSSEDIARLRWYLSF